MSSSRNIPGIVVGAAVVLALAGCSGPADGEAASQTVCFITGTETNPYGTRLNDALQEGADESGVEILRINQEFDPQKGADAMNTCLSRSVDAIILWPVDPSAYLAGLTAAKNQGIPVTIVNSPVDEQSLALVQAWSGPDNIEEGRMMAEALDGALAGVGNVVNIEGVPGNSTTIDRTKGFVDELSAVGSKIDVIATVTSNFDTQTSLQASRDVITRFGDQIDAVFADDASGPGFVQAWKESGQTGPIPLVTGINGQQDVFDLIRSGEMFATILQPPALDGSTAWEIMDRVLAGEEVDKMNPIELTLVTKDNVDEIEPVF